MSLLALNCCMMMAAIAAPGDAVWEQAGRNGEMNRKALLACKRYVDGWLEHADPETGLIPRNLSKDFYWNAKDAAADNYPFMVLTTYYTNRTLFEGRMKEILETEQRLCNRLDRLPDDLQLDTGTFRTPEYRIEDLIFGAAEYAKDGLTPVVELLGPSPWADRMRGLLEDIWKHAGIDTEAGLLPATSHEVCGDLMQSLARTYWMTANETYREWAFRLADYFLLHHSPVDVDRLRLDDHGCEVIGGLAEVYCIAAHKDPQRRDMWRPALHTVLDRILEIARDDHGLLISAVNPRTGEWLTDDRTDNWGYTYNAFLSVAAVDPACERYVDAVAFVLKNLPANKDYPWEGDKADGIADSLEGGLNLINRLPVPEAIEWADYMAERLLAKQRDTGVIVGWHGDGNFARTALMFALWKSAGAYVVPWRSDLRVGAVLDGDRMYFVVTSDWPWTGVLHFDRPRHVEFLGMPKDYARLNQFPDWFTVSQASIVRSETGEQYETARLREGLPISVHPDKPFRITLKKAKDHP